MTTNEDFKAFATEMIDYVANYLGNIRERPSVLPDVQPGYLKALMPKEAPDKPESWQDVMGDLEKLIMPGVTHWNSPHFHAYYPCTTSYPAIVADILTSALNVVGFSWISGPICTELETVVVNWLAKWFDLPHFFQFAENNRGGGVIQGTVSEAIFFTMLNIKEKALKSDKSLRAEDLVAYASSQTHISCQRAALLCGVQLHLVDLSADLCMTGAALQKAIDEDRSKGLTPFFAVGTFGTTDCCTFDKVDEMGPICREHDIWLHVDAAYAGVALICPELRYLMRGLEQVDSLSINVHKWMLVPFDCSVLWVRDSSRITEIFAMDAAYLTKSGNDVPNYRDWHIPFSRRMRSIKLWFVMRLYGKEGIQRHIRNHVNLAALFQTLMTKDERFELVCPRRLGLVCFGLKDQSNEVNQELNRRVNKEGRIHVTPTTVRGKFFIRFVIVAEQTNEQDVKFAVHIFSRHADAILSQKKIERNLKPTIIEEIVEKKVFIA